MCLFTKEKGFFVKIVYWCEGKTIDFIKKRLQFENIIIGSSDTVFGLLANVSREGFKKLNAIKQRFNKPYLVLIANKMCLNHFVDVNNLLQMEKFINFCWPGPVTLIFKAKQSVPDFMKSKKGTIALRVPDHTGLQKLLPHFIGLFSTSANIGGNPIPRTIEEIDERIVKQIACVVLDKKEKRVGSLPSTIIDCSGDRIIVVREGAYPIDELRKKMERVSIHLDYHL